MAITPLPTNFVDAETEQYEYKVTSVGNDEALFEDVSEYTTYGSPFGAHEINTQHEAVNDTIDLSESTASDITKLKNGTTIPENVTSADEVTSATTATSVNYASTATSADYVERATSATTATRATTTPQLTGGGKINGVTFNGTQNITIEDNSRLAKSKSFVLTTKQTLTFTNKVCEVSDNRITADSLAEVIFTNDCLDDAMRVLIGVETMSGKVRLTAGRTPSGTITATIFIRVVD